jgi:hypothetical protein
MKRATWVPFAVIVPLWGLSWLFARDLVKGLEALGILPRRGLLFSDLSDLAFSLVVLSILLALWAAWRMLGALARRNERGRAFEALEDAPRYRELNRRKEQLLRDLKDLEFDRDLHKISPADYAVVERRLRDEATRVLRELDVVDPVQVYAERIREDLRPYLARLGSTQAGDDGWRERVLGEPLYQELAPLLGERDLLLAALRDHWVVEAEVDRTSPKDTVLTVEDRSTHERFRTTLGGLRARLLDRLAQGDEAETLRLARIAGWNVQKTEGALLRCERDGTALECSPQDLRPRILQALSAELGQGVPA